MFYMPLRSTGVGTPSRTVYKELRAFGPGENPRFSPSLILGVQQAANRTWRSVRAFCRGWVQVVGVEAGHPPGQPDAPLVVSLMPHWAEMIELTRICQLHQMETPCLLLYGGIEPASLQLRLLPILKKAAEHVPAPAISEETLWQSFVRGEMSAFVGGGMEVGVVHEGSQPGTYPLSITVVTARLDRKREGGPKQVLDPVTLFHRLAGEKLIDGSPAMVKTETINSWLDVVRKDRVLITFRDEWNEPSAPYGVVISSAEGEMHKDLKPDDCGTMEVSGIRTDSRCRVAEHMLTPVASAQGAMKEVGIAAQAPAHLIIGIINPSLWLSKAQFLSDPTKRLSLFTEGNNVELLVDGFTFFPRMAEDLQQVCSNEHWILIAGWWTEFSFELIPKREDTTMNALLQRADGSGAMIRAMLWSLFNFWPCEFIKRGLKNQDHDAAVLDARTHHNGVDHAGAHHAKYTVIKNSNGVFAYVGGIDFNPNRLDGPDHLPEHTRYHDVGCRIEGPAAQEVAKSFADRWNDHPDNQNNKLNPLLSPDKSVNGTCMVQVTRTYGAGTLSYALMGERTIWDSINTAVARAKKYIYIEDQYLVYPNLSDALKAALCRIEHLIIVIDGNCDLGRPKIPDITAATAQCNKARDYFLTPLLEAAPAKVHVFMLADEYGIYKVHTKAIIIDDVWATIGSANMNRRGMTHDTELNVCVLDGKIVQGRREFARDMRIRLWSEHLKWHRRDPLSIEMDLGDIDKAIQNFLVNRPAGARLKPYETSISHGSMTSDWIDLVDPNGSLPPRPTT